jgi:dephospho-CoA kinase
MLKVGITGGIGSGKTTVCKIFQTLGIPIYYADDEAKKLYDTDAEMKQEIIAHFGEGVYKNNYFDKDALREIVFNDIEKLKLLNSIVHPRVKKQADEWMQKQTAPYAIKEAALMIESASNLSLDKLILVSCPLDKRIVRVIKRDHTSQDEAMNRATKQTTDEEKRKFCDYEIINDDEHLVIPQVLKLHEELLKKSQIPNVGCQVDDLKK